MGIVKQMIIVRIRGLQLSSRLLPHLPNINIRAGIFDRLQMKMILSWLIGRNKCRIKSLKSFGTSWCSSKNWTKMVYLEMYARWLKHGDRWKHKCYPSPISNGKKLSDAKEMISSLKWKFQYLTADRRMER